MAVIDNLIAQIDNKELRNRIQREVERMNKHKKFGLVFEEHRPEYTLLYDIKVTVGSNVMKKNDPKNDNIFKVIGIKDEIAYCIKELNNETTKFNISELVCVAQFGEPIYPYLKHIDSICNDKDSDLWHTLIQADNYHALQLLEYLYAGKVDCIYIDPPYNSGATDWKYNNKYVDESDNYRHSKWLSFMEKRLKLAKKLLNPNDSVMIITIDEKEYLHLGCLLEEMFPEARIQMISSIISRKGTARADEFSRTNEFIYFVRFGACSIEKLNEVKSVAGESEVHWQPLRRSDLASKRGTTKGGTSQFYPIYVDVSSRKIVHIGEPISPEAPLDSVPNIEGAVPVFPIRDNGIEMNWGLVGSELQKRLQKGYVRVGKFTEDKPQKFVLNYLTSGTIKDIEKGKAKIKSYAEDGSVKAYYSEGKHSLPTTQWDVVVHDAKIYGTGLNSALMPDRVFPFPKSVYAVEDCLKYFVTNKTNALIVDFFSGSGTTLNAVNLINSKDNGNRRCIMITNNEVSADEKSEFEKRGISIGDEEYEKAGIARFFTWPRTVASITGKDTLGNDVKWDYGKPSKGIDLGYSLPSSNGFKANANFFKLGFLNKNYVALGRQLKELIPVLWMKANAIGECPIECNTETDMIILPKNKMAILIDENNFAKFKTYIDKHSEIETVFIITDYETAYQTMASKLKVKNIYQLYRDYLDNFRINKER